MDWFLNDRDLHHERVNALLLVFIHRDVYYLIMRQNNQHQCIQITLSGDSQGQETFLAPPATRNHDTECSNHYPSLSP